MTTKQVLPFNSVLILAVRNIDELYRASNELTVNPFQIPKYISSNLLGKQRILFVAKEDQLSILGQAAIAITSNTPIERVLTGKILQDDWAAMSSGVQKLKDSIPALSLQIHCDDSAIEFEGVLAEIHEGGGVDVVIADIALQAKFGEDVARLSEQLGASLYFKPFFTSSDLLSDATLPTIESVLTDPSASHWLKSGLKAALTRDPVDAANDAELLAKLLDNRVNQLAREAKVSRPQSTPTESPTP